MKKTTLLGFAIVIYSCIFSQKIYFVDIVKGTDIGNNVGSSANPFKTIQKAADAVAPGDTVIVRDGIYIANNKSHVVNFKVSGNSSKWIVFKSEHKGGAIISGNKYTVNYGFHISSNIGYIQIEDFVIKEMLWTGINIESTNNIKIIGNEIRDIGRECTSTSYGKTGIYANQAQKITIEQNKFFNIGRLALNEYGCNTDINNYSHDHAIYIEGGSNWVVKNNIFDSIFHGWGVHIYSGHNYRPKNILIANNTFFNPNPAKDGQVIISNPGADNVMIANNIFYRPNNLGVYIEYSNSSIFSNINLLNNIIFPAKGPGGISNYIVPGVSISGNLYNTDPLLADPGNHTSTLLPGSPAIDAGIDLYAQGVTDDIDNICRPTGIKTDIGASEFLNITIRDYSNYPDACNPLAKTNQALVFGLDFLKPQCSAFDIANIEWTSVEYSRDGNTVIGLIDKASATGMIPFITKAPNTTGGLVISVDITLKNGKHATAKTPFIWVTSGTGVDYLVKMQVFDKNVKTFVDYDWPNQIYARKNNLLPDSRYRVTIQTPNNIPNVNTFLKDFSTSIIYNCPLKSTICENAINLLKPAVDKQWTVFNTGPNGSFLNILFNVTYKSGCTFGWYLPFTVRNPISIAYPNSSVDENSFNDKLESKSNVQFNILPNPSNGIFELQCSSKQATSVEIYDPFGKSILKRNLKSFTDKKFDLSKFSKGIYLLKINTISFGTETQKILIQ